MQAGSGLYHFLGRSRTPHLPSVDTRERMLPPKGIRHMKDSIRALAIGLAASVCLWPGAASAQVQPAPFTTTASSVEQVRDSFSSAGFQVDATLTWDWTAPPVSSIQIHDPAGGRVLLALVYPDAAAADLGRRQALANEPQTPPAGLGPHLVAGYGQSIWRGNVALVQTTQSELRRAFQIQNERDNAMSVTAVLAPEPEPANYAVDLDFLRALDNSAVNL